jgi:hypothetical protein
MKCDNFLPALETGGFVRRLQARCHAVRCPGCTATRAALTATKQRLATPEPLSPHARRLWELAASEVIVRPATRRVWAPTAAGLGAVACILLFLVAVAVRKEFLTPQLNPEVRNFNPPPETEVVGTVDSAKELSGLAAAVKRLDADLQRLQREAERVDAQQQIATTLNQFDRW